MKILMARPTGFQVKDVQNPHMVDNRDKVDTKLAIKQWQELVEVIKTLGVKVHVIETDQLSHQLEDVVFTANCGLVNKSPIPKHFILSNMVYPSRQKERSVFKEYFSFFKYHIVELDKKYKFEGQGDCIWHPSNYLLFAGYGFRTDLVALFEIQKHFPALEIVPIKLKNYSFYHLDTCFCPINDDTVMLTELAFEPQELAVIKQHFKNVISVSDKDAFNFACNAVVLNDSIVLNRGISNELKNKLFEEGLQVVEIDLSEFLKSGGSAACMVIKI